MAAVFKVFIVFVIVIEWFNSIKYVGKNVFCFVFKGASSGSVSPSRKEQPLFTLRQVGMICERLIKEREEKVREEYEEMMTTKLAGAHLGVKVPKNCALYILMDRCKLWNCNVLQNNMIPS